MTLPVRRAASFALLVGLAGPLAAFPPAPPHVIYGVIRDKIGQPLMNASAGGSMPTSPTCSTQPSYPQAFSTTRKTSWRTRI